MFLIVSVLFSFGKGGVLCLITLFIHNTYNFLKLKFFLNSRHIGLLLNLLIITHIASYLISIIGSLDAGKSVIKFIIINYYNFLSFNII